MRSIGLALLLVAWCAAGARGEETPAAEDDVQDLVFMSPSRPLLARLHIAINGQPLGDARRYAAAVKSDPTASSKSTPEHNFVIQQVPSTSRNAAPALFSLLDANGDGQLSAAEMADAPERLRCRDFDDNGLISGLEMLRDTAIETSGPALAALVVAIDEEHPPATIGAAILARYDRDGDERLRIKEPKSEATFEATALARLDANGDGELEAGELAAFSSGAPDIELWFEFGRGRSRLAEHQKFGSDEFRIYRRLDGGYKLTINDARIVFSRNNRNPTAADAQEFKLKTLDTDGNEYLDENEVAAVPALAGEFKTLDADADGKVFGGELDAFLSQRAKGDAARMLLQVSDDGQDLFSMIDADKDGFLSPRELRGAIELSRTQDANGDGMLGAHEIPQQITLELSRGATVRQAQMAASAGMRAPAMKTPMNGPIWFRKMDRNGDGDVSRGEFLGPAEKFDKLDVDADGLISVEEAGRP